MAFISDGTRLDPVVVFQSCYLRYTDCYADTDGRNMNDFILDGEESIVHWRKNMGVCWVSLLVVGLVMAACSPELIRKDGE